MTLPFEKWHGCQNDFLVVRLAASDGQNLLNVMKRLAPSFCDRHSGMGADGLLVLVGKTRDDPSPKRLVIFNSDGSEAKNCGNGLRCAAGSVVKRAGSSIQQVDFDVDGRVMSCQRLRAGDGHVPAVFSVELGVTKTGKDVPWLDAATTAVRDVGLSLGITGLETKLGVCDIGNPHIVITTPAASAELVRKVGPALQTNSRWPGWDGMNVHLVRQTPPQDHDQARAEAELSGERINDTFKAFVWERGAGETMACGTGVGAIAATAWTSGATPRAGWVAVDMPGGRLYARQQAATESVTLAGPAAFICRGEVEI